EIANNVSIRSEVHRNWQDAQRNEHGFYAMTVLPSKNQNDVLDLMLSRGSDCQVDFLLRSRRSSTDCVFRWIDFENNGGDVAIGAQFACHLSRRKQRFIANEHRPLFGKGAVCHRFLQEMFKHASPNEQKD